MPSEKIINLEQPVNDLDVQQAKAKLEAKIHNLNAQGWHNQFDYANYGVQYNPIYDKETGRVKTLGESNLSPEAYVHLANTMTSAPELTSEWNEERAKQIASKVFDTLESRDIIAQYKHKFASKEDFIKAYVEAVKKYHQDDEDFNYEVIKSLFTESGGQSIPGYNESPTTPRGESRWSSTMATNTEGLV